MLDLAKELTELAARGISVCLVNDDNGKWAFSEAGTLPSDLGLKKYETFQEVWTTPDSWHRTIEAAWEWYKAHVLPDEEDQ